MRSFVSDRITRGREGASERTASGVQDLVSLAESGDRLAAEYADHAGRYMDRRIDSVPRRFGASFAGALLLLLILVSSIDPGTAVAYSFSNVGGHKATIDRIEGVNAKLFPATAATDNCPDTSSGPGDPDSYEEALPLMKATLDSATVPAGASMTVTKDIKVPDTPVVGDIMDPINYVRINITKPPTANPAELTNVSFLSTYVEADNLTMASDWSEGVVINDRNSSRTFGPNGKFVMKASSMSGTAPNLVMVNTTQRVHFLGAQTMSVPRTEMTIRFNPSNPIVATDECPVHDVGFDVEIVATNSPVTEGDPVEVKVNVTNYNDTADTQDIPLLINGTQVDVNSGLSLNAGQSSVFNLTWSSTNGEVATHNATVTSDDDADKRNVTVQEPEAPFYKVTILETNSPIEDGDTLNVTAAVENTGGTTGSQDIPLLIDGTQEDVNSSLTLTPGENVTLGLNWTTSGGDIGTHNATVASDNDSDETTVEVEDNLQNAFFAVNITSTNSPVSEGQTLNVTANVTNTGDFEGTQDVELLINGTQEDVNTSLTLAAGESTDVLLQWATGNNDQGTYNATVASQNDSDETTVNVTAPAPYFDVTITSTNSPVNQSETLNVTADITNTGTASGSQTITLDIDGTQVDSTTVNNLNAGNTQTVTLSWTTGSGDAGDHTANVSSENDSDTQTVHVNQPPFFDVVIDSTNSPVVEGNDLNVTTTVTNTGEQTGTQTIELSINGSLNDSRSVTLDPGQSTTFNLTWATQVGDAGNYTATVSSANTSDSQDVRVLEQAFFDVTITGNYPDDPLEEGNTVWFNFSVTNTGDVSDTQDVRLYWDGRDFSGLSNTTSITLSAGQTVTDSLAYHEDCNDNGNHTDTGIINTSGTGSQDSDSMNWTDTQKC